MKKLLGIGLIGMLAMVCQGASIRPLPVESKADMGATHVATITYADLATASTNTFVLTNAVTAAKQSYELVAMVLVTPFFDTATNAHNSTLITVGDGDDADLYLESTELNSNGTEVYVKFPRSERTLSTTSATRTNMTGITVATAVLTNLVYDGGAITGNVTYVTGVTPTTAAQASLTAASDAGSDFGRKLYTAAGAIKTTFTGTLPYPLSALDAGEVRLYFRIKDAAKQNP